MMTIVTPYKRVFFYNATANRENNHHVDKTMTIKVLLIGTSKQTGVATLITHGSMAIPKLGCYQNPKASGKVRDPFYSIPYCFGGFNGK